MSSRVNYEIHVKNYGHSRESSIMERVCSIFGIDTEKVNLVRGASFLWLNETVRISGGAGKFRKELRDAIWICNEGPCEIEIRETYLDQAPVEEFCFCEVDYGEWKDKK